MAKVRFLAVVTLECEDYETDSVFQSFQEEVESMGDVQLERARISDLEEFTPDVVVIQPGLDLLVCPLEVED